MMAALQVQEALKLLHGLPVAAGTALVFNGVGNQFYSTRLPFRDDCLSHETYPEPVELPLGHAATVAELLAAARADAGGAAAAGAGPRAGRGGRLPALRLAAARSCGRGPRSRQAEAVCPNCREPAGPSSSAPSTRIRRWPAGRLPDVGVPPYDIVRVDGGRDRGSSSWPAIERTAPAGWGLSR